MAYLTLQDQIKNPRSKIVRRLLIKRRNLGTGTYESSWQDITGDVIKWGSVKKEVDATRINQFKFNNVTLTLDNELGRYNAFNDENSLWFGYGDQQRTLVKILAYFVRQEKTNGVWTNQAIGIESNWDENEFDPDTHYNESVLFSGYISGDINLVGNNQVNIPVVPLFESFRQFTASRLTGYNSSLTASDFMFMLRDQQDVNGAYIFRPFFGDTTSGWDITTTTVEYANLNTAGSEDILNKNVWEVVQKLAEAENFVPIVTAQGTFRFISRNVNTTPVYSFYGGQSYSSEYGHTIKKINWYGRRFTKYYSRVSVKWNAADTTTSYEIADSQYLVSGDSGPWTLGERTLSIDNTWIPTSSIAETIADSLFEEFSAIRTEVELQTTFVPQLEVLDRVYVTYDQTPVTNASLWDVYNWQDTGTADEPNGLFWDDSKGDSIKMYEKEFRVISIDINLDNCECKFTLRE